MLALYGRQSADKKDSISIESQIEFCKYETRGEPYREYTDKGFSGKNTDRPQFKQMIQDIKNGEISKVIVYKLDRISRSILDFAEMMQMFEEYHVEFVSSTEKFDTSTPMGRAMLNICIVFAQLERETIQKRVTDAYHSRFKRGYYMGGRIPYGFTTEKIIMDNIKTSRYIPVKEEMEQIKLIYEMYADPTTSIGQITRYLAENHIHHLRNKTHTWGTSTISLLLKSPIYVKADLDIYDFFKNQGVNIVNPPKDFVGTNGCYLYNENEVGKRKEVSLEGHTLVLAPHEGIIPSDVWLKTRAKSLYNAKNKFINTHKTKNTWLAGKIKCGKCKHALVVRKGHPTPKKTVRYFYCQHQVTYRSCEGVRGIYVDNIEEMVEEEIKQRLSDFKALSRGAIKKQTNPKLTELKIKATQIDNEIDTLMSKVPSANDVLMEYINKQIVELDKKRKTINQEIKDLTPAISSIDYKSIVNHIEQWDKSSFDDKRAVLDILIEMVLVTEESIEIKWKL